MGWSSKWDEDKTELIIGIDKSLNDDKTIVSIADGKILNVIGESINLVISIKNGWEDIALKAIRIGDLAIHQPIPANGTDYDWCITHIPTLTCFDAAVPDGDWTQEQLIRWCWKVQQSTDLWQAICSYDNSTYKSIPKGFLNALKKHCLSISI